MTTIRDLEDTMDQLGKKAFDLAVMVIARHEQKDLPPCTCKDCEAARSCMEAFR